MKTAELQNIGATFPQEYEDRGSYERLKSLRDHYLEQYEAYFDETHRKLGVASEKETASTRCEFDRRVAAAAVSLASR
mgnify:CR=1 FL=1